MAVEFGAAVRRWLRCVRPCAAGVDIGVDGIRVVVVSRGFAKRAAARVDWLAFAPLPHGAVRGAEIVDRAAVGAALAHAFSALPRACTRAKRRCATALPPAATLASRLPLAWGEASAEDALATEWEPQALAEAERIAGVEAHALALDWRIERPGADPGDESPPHLAVTTAARPHLDARLECAARARLTLSALDGAAPAALRALCHAARTELPAGESCAMLWIGPDDLYGWYFDGAAIVREVRYPAADYASAADALRDLCGGRRAECALLAGDVERLAPVTPTLAGIGAALGCVVLPFECAPFFGAGMHPSMAALARDAAFAVAFGLALRGMDA